MSDTDRTATEVVTTVNPDGSLRVTPIDPNDPDPRVQRFVQGGHTDPLTPELAAELERSTSREDRVAAAGEAGIAETFGGASMTALNELLLGLPAMSDPELRERLQEFQEGNPVIGGGSRLAAWIAPAILAGPETLLGRAASYAPAGAAARLGVAAEQALGRALAGRAGVRGLGRVANAAVEGTLSSMGESIAEANLRGTPLDAEQILADGAFGGMIGIGAVLPFEGLGALARRTARSADAPGAGLTGPVPRGPGEEFTFRRTTPRETAGTLDWNIAGVRERDMQRIRGAREEGIDPWNASDFRSTVNDTAERFASALNRTEEVFRSGLDRDARLQNTFRRGLAPVDAPAAAQQFGDMNRLLNEALANTENTALRGQLEAIRTRSLSVVPESVEDLVRMNDSVLQVLADNQLVRQADRSGANPTFSRFMRQAEINLDHLGASDLAGWHRAYRQHLSDMGPIERYAQRVDTGDGINRWRVQGNNLMSVMQGTAGEVVSAQTVDELIRLGQVQEGFVEAAERLMGTDGTAARLEMASAMDALERADRYSGYREAALRAELNEKGGAGLFAGMGISGQQVGIAAGGAAFLATGNPAVGLAVGGAASLGFTVATHPVATMRLLDRLAGAKRNSTERLNEGMGRIRGVLERGGSFSRSAGRVLPPTVAVLRDSQKREAAYREYRDRILEMAGNPAAFTAALDDSANAVGSFISPQLGDAMAMRVQAGVQFLAANLPASDQPSLFDMFETEDPSLVEMDRWLNMFEAIENPLGLLDKLAEGSLEVEHVDAVQAVYPELLTLVRAELTQIVAGLSSLPSYQQRMELGTLLGVPVDRTLSSSFVHSMQQNFAQTAQQDQTQTSRTAFRRSVSMTVADDTHTATQSLQHSLG